MRKWIFISYGLALALGVFLLMSLETRVWNAYGKPYCLADCLAASGYSWIFGLLHLVMAMILVVSNQIEAVDTNFALRFRTRSEIWRWQISSSVKYAVGTGTLFAAAALVSGSLQSTEIFNWDSVGSVFYENTETVYLGGFMSVWSLFWFWCVWKTFFWLLLMNLMRLWKNKGYICWLLLMAFICTEWGSKRIRMFFTVFHIGYFVMQDEAYIGAAVLGAGILSAGLFWVGKIVIEQREFL